jgi:GTP cyclohydrolase I
MNQQKIEDAVKIILQEIGEDINREGIIQTPKRVARLYKNLFYGYTKDIKVMDENERNGEQYEKNIIPITTFKANSQELLIRRVKFNSFCEHHMVPFVGEAWVGIIPNQKLLGMNKIDKIVKYFGARLQIQEKMNKHIADWINDNIEPLGVAVVIKANHMCAELQGDEGHFVTSAIRGKFLNEPELRAEFYSLIK